MDKLGWNGVFLHPRLLKHRDGCGDIRNHIRLTSTPVVTGTVIKEGSKDESFYVVHVDVEFIDGEGSYDYEVEVSDPDDLDEILDEVASQVQP